MKQRVILNQFVGQMAVWILLCRKWILVTAGTLLLYYVHRVKNKELKR
jgi:hypothetical protein